VGELVDYVLQHHKALRAGEHDDLRVAGEGGLHSWAVPKGLPQPGQRVLAVHQPLHDPAYAGFAGRIRSGYGAGEVERKDRGKVLVTSASPDKVTFVVAHKKQPEEFTMVRTKDKQWILTNRTPVDASWIPDKPHYQSKRWKSVRDHLEGLVGEPKADGASGLFRLGDRVDAFSHRKSKDGKPIWHTHRLFGADIPKVPKELRGSILRGEILGMRDGKAIPPQALGGLLNSTLAKSLEDQKASKTELKTMLFGEVGFENLPPTERRARLQRFVDALGEKFFLPESADNPEDIRRMHDDIAAGKNPLTEEGVVLYPNEGGKPIKVKNTEDQDVVVREIFGGKNRLEGKGAGGFRYSMEPDGPIVGEVGSGLTDETRRMLLENPDDFIGRIAKVRATRRMPSGALYQPVFLAMHEDPTLGTEKAANAELASYLDQPKYFGRANSKVRASDILAAAQSAKVDPRLLASVVANESAWGTHPNARAANNFTGMMGSGKELFKYPTPRAGLDAAASLLKRRYIDRGLTTPGKIGPVYAPTVGATNDPNGINNNWVKTVSGIMNRMPGAPPSQPTATKPVLVRPATQPTPAPYRVMVDGVNKVQGPDGQWRGQVLPLPQDPMEGFVDETPDTPVKRAMENPTPIGFDGKELAPMSLSEWCRRIGNVASGPARIIPFNPVTMKLEDPLEKVASRLTSLLRIGALGNQSLRRLGLGGLRTTTPKASLDNALRMMRFNSKATPNGELLPAHLAYSAGDGSAVGRLAGLAGRSPMAYQGLSIRNVTPKLNDVWASRAARPLRVEAPTSFGGGHEFSWGGGQKGFGAANRRHYFNPKTNEISIPSYGSATSRHELGHWRQFQLAEVNPAKLNIQTHLGFRRLQKADTHLASQVAGNSTAGVEFQGHLLATKGNGRGATRLRQATATSPELGRIHTASSKLRTHPATANNPEVISAVEHLLRNYGASPAIGVPGYNKAFNLYANGSHVFYPKPSLTKLASRRWATMLPHMQPRNALKMLSGILKSRAANDTVTGGVLTGSPGFGLERALRSIHAARTYPHLQTPEVINGIAKLVKNDAPQHLRAGLHTDYGSRTGLIKHVLRQSDGKVDALKALRHARQSKYGGGADAVGERFMTATHAVDPFVAQTLGGLRKSRGVIGGRSYGSFASDGGGGRLWTSPISGGPKLNDSGLVGRYAGGAYSYADTPALTLMKSTVAPRVGKAQNSYVDAQYLFAPENISGAIASSKTLPLNPARNLLGYNDELESALRAAGAADLPTTALAPRAQASMNRWLAKSAGPVKSASTALEYGVTKDQEEHPLASVMGSFNDAGTSKAASDESNAVELASGIGLSGGIGTIAGHRSGRAIRDKGRRLSDKWYDKVKEVYAQQNKMLTPSGKGRDIALERGVRASDEFKTLSDLARSYARRAAQARATVARLSAVKTMKGGALGVGVSGLAVVLASLLTGRKTTAPTKKEASTLPGDLRRAINQTHTHPTPGQIDAGNYAKGTFPWKGLTIKIENPEGTTRSGVSKSGKKWSVVMKSTYGYFRNTDGKDGDPVDVFIGPDVESDVVAVIDQEIDGKFDEHKVIIGVKDEKQARETYLSNYQKGWKCGPITMTNVDNFKKWLRDGDTKQPFALSEQALIAQGSCCGHGCANCPYSPKHKKGATKLR
jgi:hypothetical protein